MRIHLLLAALGIAAVTTVLSAQSFNPKLGQWEYTINMKLPPEVLAGIPAAAREQFLRPQTTQSCLTAQDLNDLKLGRTEENCQVTSKKITGNAADIVMKCDGRTQTMHYEALSPESMRGTIKTNGGEGPSDMTLTGKWLAAACK